MRNLHSVLFSKSSIVSGLYPKQPLPPHHKLKSYLTKDPGNDRTNVSGTTVVCGTKSGLAMTASNFTTINMPATMGFYNVAVFATQLKNTMVYAPFVPSAEAASVLVALLFYRRHKRHCTYTLLTTINSCLRAKRRTK